MSGHSLQEINDAITEVAGGSRTWSKFVPLLAKRHPDARFALIVATPGTHTELVDQAAVGYDESYLKSYAEHFQFLNTWTKTHFQFDETPRVYSTRDEAALPIQDELLTTEFYNDWVKPQDDISEGLAMMCGAGPNTRIALTSNLPARAADKMLPQLVDDFRALLQPIVRAIKTRIVLDTADVHRANFEMSLELLNSAVCVLTGDGRFVFQNAACKAQWATGEAIQVLGTGELQFRTTEGTATTTAGALLKHSHIRNGANFSITRREGQRPFLCHFTGLAGHTALLGKNQPRYLMFLTDPEMLAPLPSIGLVCDYLSITPSEAKVALELARGGRSADVARNLQISPNTVRNHLASIMQKTRCQRTSDVVALVKSIGNRAGGHSQR
jgi:DNA-binding CsgD family transcriptional regulator